MLPTAWHLPRQVERAAGRQQAAQNASVTNHIQLATLGSAGHDCRRQHGATAPFIAPHGAAAQRWQSQ